MPTKSMPIFWPFYTCLHCLIPFTYIGTANLLRLAVEISVKCPLNIMIVSDTTTSSGSMCHISTAPCNKKITLRSF